MLNNEENLVEEVQNYLEIKCSTRQETKQFLYHFFRKDCLFNFDVLATTPEDLRAVQVGVAYDSKNQALTEWMEGKDGMPEAIPNFLKSYFKTQYGYTNWRDWRLDHWGTLWNPKAVKINLKEETTLLYQFKTVQVPFGIIKELERFKTFNISFLWTIYKMGQDQTPRLFSSKVEDSANFIRTKQTL